MPLHGRPPHSAGPAGKAHPAALKPARGPHQELAAPGAKAKLQLQLRREPVTPGEIAAPPRRGVFAGNANGSNGSNARRVRVGTGNAPSLTPETPSYRSGFGRSAPSPREGSSRVAFANCP